MSSVEDEANEEYDVDAIMGKRRNKKGQTEYLVKWSGFDSADNTWERTTNLYCPEKIKAYEDAKVPDRQKRA